MSDKKPTGRERDPSGQSGSVGRRGEGLGQGPVGGGGGYGGRPGTGSGSGGGQRASSSSSSSSALGGLLSLLLGGKSTKTIIIILVVAVILFAVFGGFKKCSTNTGALSSFVPSSTYEGGWTRTANTGTLNTNVASGARAKYTTVKGGGQDSFTVMVYMCGTDLESKSGMASADLGEMAAATLDNEKLQIIVYTGGCTGWKTTQISNTTNQIWRVKHGSIERLESDAGNVSMTKPATLTSFIKWCADKYPANRNMLIFWDHGGGSLSGYGYDQRFTSSGSMSLAGINTALKDAGLKFDIIGFDACLMATAENALMLSNYADYLIASEETEPGLGWFYTGWLNDLSANTSVSSIEIGKKIADDFTDTCAKKLDSPKTTLSVIDLAEFSATFPDTLKSFASKTLELIDSDKYTEVSEARSGTREFSVSSQIDQVDLVNLADRMNTSEGKALSEAILSAVKYNRTSPSMTNSYGVSIYFPLKKVSKVDSAVNAYSAIGMDSEYSKCISTFAGMEVAGQVSSGGTSNPLSALTGSLTDGSPSITGDLLTNLLGNFVGGGSGVSIDGLTSSNSSFLSLLDIGKASSFVSANALNASDFVFINDGGRRVVRLSDEKWELVSNIELNVFVDDGKGYIDMGLDSVFETDGNDLIAEYDGMWPSVNGQPVAFYHLSTVTDGDSYTITGRIPVYIDGSRADLIAVYEKGKGGKITSVSYEYASDETETVAKSIDITELENGAKIDFVADYYTYSGEYQDSYFIGEQIVFDGTLTLKDITLTNKLSATYRITDIYGQHFWTDEMNG
ncbi:MAG: peptidase C11 [Clostridiales bacterium]|nr:peptidase C11 [Clostridiales bacterium]